MRGLSVLLLLGSAAIAQTSSTNLPKQVAEAAVREQMMALRSAELNYDAGSAAKLFKDGFFLTMTEGNLISKDQFLKVIADKTNPLQVFEYSEMKIDVYGTTAVVFSKLHEKGFLNGKPFELNGRPTWTWIKQKDRWVCVAAHD